MSISRVRWWSCPIAWGARACKAAKPSYGRASKKGGLEDNRELFEFYAGGSDGGASDFVGSKWGESDDAAIRNKRAT